MRKIGYSIKNNSPSLFLDISEAINSGFNHVELKLMSVRINKHLIADLADVISSYRPEISFSVHSPLNNVNIGSLNEKIRTSSVAKIVNSIKIANKLGVEFLVFHGGKIPQGNSREKVFVKKALDAQTQSIKEILDYCENFQLKCALENGYTTKDLGLVVNFNDFKFIIEKFPGINILVDIGHFRINSSLEEMELALDREIVNHIIAIHLHDNNKDYDEHLSLGEGSIMSERDHLEIILKKLPEKTIILENLCLDDANKSKNILLAYKLIQD
ncbi:MAG: sugar phosphate isomerase/epimerase family protein [Candidatus Hodarchaeales archaeon]